MNASVEDLRPTIVPKSDQLNAEQLLGGPMTVMVTDVETTSSDEQPVIVHYEGENGRPYKPCKTCRKVLIHAWGPDGRAWIGRAMTLYNDQSVKFGGEDVGGIRISHMTDIPSDVQVSLTSTRGKKAKYRIKLLQVERGPSLDAVLAAIAAASNKAGMSAAKALAEKLKNPADIAQAQAAYRERIAALKAPPASTQPPPAPTVDEFVERIDAADDPDDAQRILDSARDVLGATDLGVLQDALDRAWRA